MTGCLPLLQSVDGDSRHTVLRNGSFDGSKCQYCNQIRTVAISERRCCDCTPAGSTAASARASNCTGGQLSPASWCQLQQHRIVNADLPCCNNKETMLTEYQEGLQEQFQNVSGHTTWPSLVPLVYPSHAWCPKLLNLHCHLAMLFPRGIVNTAVKWPADVLCFARSSVGEEVCGCRQLSVADQ